MSSDLIESPSSGPGLCVGLRGLVLSKGSCSHLQLPMLGLGNPGTSASPWGISIITSSTGYFGSIPVPADF